jgi:glycosyltransferase involved in cell wall biosynthesis
MRNGIMKITFVIPQDGLSGGMRVVSIYAERLQQRGHCVTVVSVPPPRPSLKQRIKALFQFPSQTPRASIAQQSYFKGLNIRFQVLNECRSLRDSDLSDADVIVATWWETMEWIASVSPEKGTKVHFIQGYEMFDYVPQERVAAIYRLPYAKITISQWLFDLMQQRYNSNHLFLVPNGVDLNQFYSSTRSKAAIPTVGLVYSTTPCKGCDISLEAFNLARMQISNLRLIAFGMEPETASLPLPQEAQYSIQPQQEMLRAFYGQCDAWLVGSREEGFGLPTLEAMACGTPVIATPAGAAPELLKEGGGVLLNDFHPTSMAQAIQDICTLNAAQWLQLSEQAYQTACNHTWEKATHEFETALGQAIAAKSFV